MKNNILYACALAFMFAATPLLAVDATSTATSSPIINPHRNPRAMQVQMRNMDRQMNKQGMKMRNGIASSTVDVACAKAAIDVRGAAILSAYNTHTATVAGLIASSTIGHKAAFDLTGIERQKALRAVNQALRMGRMQSQKTLMASERETLTAFRTAMRACGAKDAEIDKGQPLVQ